MKAPALWQNRVSGTPRGISSTTGNLHALEEHHDLEEQNEGPSSSDRFLQSCKMEAAQSLSRTADLYSMPLDLFAMVSRLENLVRLFIEDLTPSCMVRSSWHIATKVYGTRITMLSSQQQAYRPSKAQWNSLNLDTDTLGACRNPWCLADCKAYVKVSYKPLDSGKWTKTLIPALAAGVQVQICW